STLRFERQRIYPARNKPMASVEIRKRSFQLEVPEVLSLRIRASNRIVVDRLRERIGRIERQPPRQLAIHAHPHAVVIRIRRRLIQVDARKTGNRSNSADALVVIAIEAKMAPLRSNVCYLH